MKKIILSLLSLVLILGLVGAVSANTIESSTMIFEGALTDNGDGTYSGVVAMVDEATAGLGDGIAGYDIYGKEGASAWFGNAPDPVWTSQLIGADHDAWPFWDPDTPDWYQYSLNLYIEGGQAKWAVRNHSSATAAHPWYDISYWGGSKPPGGVPMSGTMDWSTKLATETDTGAYLTGTGTPEIPGGAAGQGATAGAWDMDWSWGSELVPLELPQFKVAVEDLGSGTYRVSLTPFRIRDADSYYINFAWSGGRPTPGSPGGFFFLDPDSGYLTLTAARTSRAFNVYAMNNSPGVETERVEDHSAWPNWYASYGWDTPDADPSYLTLTTICEDGPYECNAPFYLLTIDTFQGKWWLFYTQYPNQPSTHGIANLYVPMSGVTHKVTTNDDGTIDIEIEEDGGDWKTLWGEDALEDVKLQDRNFVVHIDRNEKNGYMAPKQLLPKGK